MAHTLIDTVRDAIGRYELFSSGDIVVVAVSGGADSVALLVALHELRSALGIELLVAHLDHGLRGVESDADRAFVEGLAAGLALPIRVESTTIPAGNVEAEARRARYAFLERVATEAGASTIATAHTLEDQAETFLLRLVHGSGGRGLRGIRPRRGRIVRPMIACDRIQVRAFLVDRKYDWRRDRSNFDLRLERARVRAGFLPALAREFNPRLPRTLARLADILGEEDALLDRLAAAAVRDAPALDVAVLRALEVPLARRGVRRWWRRHGSGRRLGMVHVEAVLALARRDEGGGRIEVPGGRVTRVGRELRFVERAEEEAAPYALVLSVGSAVDTPGGWRLGLDQARADATPDSLLCVLDADEIPATLSVRNRRPGDRIRPLGLGGHTTIKRLFIARRVPRAERAAYPLVVVDDEVLWVPGCARSDRALVTARTRRRLVLRAERLS